MRLVLSHLLVIVVVLGVAGFALLTQSRRYFVNADRRALLVQARTVASSCDGACVASGQVNAGLSNVSLPAGATVSQNRNIAGRVNTVEPSSQRIQTELTSTLTIVKRGADVSDSAIASALSGNESSRIDGSALIAAAPIRQANVVIAAAVVRGDLSDVESVLGDLRRTLFAALGASALIAAIVGFLRARSIAKPIRALTVSAQAIADGDFTLPLPVGKGRDELAVLATTFVSMRERVQQELDARAAFVADASHELRTPLTAIRGSIEILQDGGADDPATRARFLNSLESETDRLLGLVNGLLDLDAGDRPAIRKLVDLSASARSVIEALAADNVHLDAPIPVAVLGDPGQLRQVLVNLIDNAKTHGGSSVRVRVFAQGRLAQVEISDEGPGVPEAERRRVFERFVRLDQSRQRDASSTSTRQRGAGLGLAIVEAIVSAHDGTVVLRSGPTGIGTSVVVTLPLSASGSIA
jgi:two-component system, OmpR family, sensor kinase